MTIGQYILFSLFLGSPLWSVVAGSDGQNHSESGTNQQGERLNLIVTEEARVVVSPSKMTFAQLEPVLLDVEIENTSARDLWLPSSTHDYWVFRAQVLDQEGRNLPQTLFQTHELSDPGLVGGSASSVGSAFHPGSTVRGQIVANLVHDMSRPGEYTVIVEVPVARDRREGGMIRRVVARSKPITIRVCRGLEAR